MCQLIENTPKIAAIELRHQVGLYIESSGPFKHRNSVHVPVSFSRGATMPVIKEAIDQLLSELVRKVGCNSYGLQATGVLIERWEREPTGHLTAVSHGHLICRSVKSRQTGRTVARLSDEARQAIADSFQGTAVQSFKLVPIHDLAGLVRYVCGPKNLGSLDEQRIYTIKLKQ